MVNRIKQIIQVKNFTYSHFADHIGIPRSTISHILSGRNKPSLDVVQKILDTFPDISTEWLIMGKGSISSSEQTLFGNIEPDQTVTHESQVDVNDDEIIKHDSIAQEGIQSEKNETASVAAEKQHEVEKATDINRKNNVENSANEVSIRSVKVIVLYSDGSYTEHTPAKST